MIFIINGVISDSLNYKQKFPAQSFSSIFQQNSQGHSFRDVLCLCEGVSSKALHYLFLFWTICSWFICKSFSFQNASVPVASIVHADIGYSITR